MKEQQELFEKSQTTLTPEGVPLVIWYLSFAFLFSVLAFLVYLFWDFGIAGRVVLFFILLLAIVHVAIYIAKVLIDKASGRRF